MSDMQHIDCMPSVLSCLVLLLSFLELFNVVNSQYFVKILLEPVSIRATSSISVLIAKLASADELLL
jgi:hypothetical protein